MNTPPAFPWESGPRRVDSRRLGALLVVLAAGWLGPGFAPIASGSTTFETSLELVTTGDFDGDSRLDVLVVDKASGSFRLGRMGLGGQLDWGEAHSVGFSPVTTLTVGRFSARAADSFIVAAPEVNRLHEIQVNRAGAPVITFLFPPQLGPVLALALDTRRAGPFAGDDLLLGSMLNSGAPAQLGLYDDPSVLFTLLDSSPLAGSRPVIARAVPVRVGSASMAGVVLRGPTSATFRLIDPNAGTLRTVLQSGSLSVTAEFSTGFVSGAVPSQLLVWDPTDASGDLEVRPINPGAGDAWSLGTASRFQFGEAIRHATVLNPAGASELLLVFASGRAATYTFDGLAAPSRASAMEAGFEPVQTLAVLGPDRVVFLGGAADGSSRYYSLQERRGADWNTVQAGSLPGLAPLRGVNNLWEYRDEPFVTANPGFIGERTVDDWTLAVSPNLLPQLRVTAEHFRDPGVGLGNPSILNGGTAGVATRHVLVNQWHPSISVFGLDQPGPRVAGNARPVPAPGHFDGSVSLRFQLDPPGAAGVSVYYRFDDQGDWLRYSQPVRLYRATTVSYFTQDSTAARSPIRTARYAFGSSAGRLDTDSDGVPDYVEVALGLDPAAGADTDGDGANDLDEIAAGTNPALARDVPGRRIGIANATTFSATVTPAVYDGRVGRLAPAAEGLLVDALTPQGRIVAQQPIVAALAPSLGSVLLPGLPRSPAGRLLAVATPPNFQGVPPVPGGNPFFGRELLALRTAPPRADIRVPFDWTSGDASVAARGWIAAARSALGNVDPPSEWPLSPDTTLAAVLFERKVEALLRARDLLRADRALTLFPHRPQDTGRQAFPDNLLLRLETPGPAGVPVHALAPMLRAITDAVYSAAGAPLRALMLDLYRISSRELDTATSLSLPVDAFRLFLATGQLPPGYAAKSSLDAEALRRAATSATSALSAPSPRPFVVRELVVPSTPAQTFDCTLLNDDQGNAWSLVDGDQRPWPLTGAFILPPGTRLRVRGFTDAPATCGTSSILVESLALVTVPAVAPTDSDGDLMDDAWERRYFGSLTQSGAGDFDGDGFSNLQEFLEGTHPADPAHRGTTAVVLGPPVLALDITPGGNLRLRFDWPEPFVSRVSFDVLSAESLGGSFDSLGLTPTRGPGGAPELELPRPSVSTRFFLIRLILR